MKPRLIVFTKAPVIGGAKSRLAAGIGKVPAWRVYRAMLATLTRKLRDSRWDLVLAVAPDRAVSRRFPGAWPDDLARMAQGCGDLGARQARVFTRRITPPRPSPQGEGEARSRYGVKRGRGGLAGRHKQLWFSPRGAGGQRRRAARLQAPLTEFRRFRQSAALQASLPPPWGRAGVGGAPVCVIGADAPQITRADIAAAFAGLKHTDAVIGPAEDGGYWLLAMNAPAPPGLFDGVRWSHAHTRADLEARLRALGLTRIKHLRTLRDVDEAGDLIKKSNPLKSRPSP